MGLQEKFVKWKKIIWALVQSKTLGANPGELRLFFQIFNPFFGPLGDLCRAFPLTQPSQILAHLFFHKNPSKNQHQRIQIEKSRNKPMPTEHAFMIVCVCNILKWNYSVPSNAIKQFDSFNALEIKKNIF